MRIVSDSDMFIIYEYDNKKEIEKTLNLLATYQYHVDEKYKVLTIFKHSL